MQENSNIKSSFRGTIIGRKYIHLLTTGSTNDVVFEIGKLEHNPEGIVVTADRQTDGRGRFGRHWVSPAAVNLYFSVLLPPVLQREDRQVLPLVAAVSIVKAIRLSTGLPAEIKWPNDIMINNRKTGGILLETKTSGKSIDLIALGIGLNVNMPEDAFPEELKLNATSLSIEGKKELDRNALLEEILRVVESDFLALASGKRKNLLKEWVEYSVTLGRTVEVRQDKIQISGFAEGISDRGELLLRMPSGKIEAVQTGDVEIPDL